MNLLRCDSCKKEAKRTEYNPTAEPERLGWVEFVANKGTSKKPEYLEISLCKECVKKVLQFLHIEW